MGGGGWPPGWRRREAHGFPQQEEGSCSTFRSATSESMWCLGNFFRQLEKALRAQSLCLWVALTILVSAGRAYGWAQATSEISGKY